MAGPGSVSDTPRVPGIQSGMSPVTEPGEVLSTAECGTKLKEQNKIETFKHILYHALILCSFSNHVFGFYFDAGTGNMEIMMVQFLHLVHLFKFFNIFSPFYFCI